MQGGTAMAINKYDQLNSFQLDVFRELGSIGSGTAATSLSNVLNQRVTMSTPNVKILENNQAIAELGGPERVVAGILLKFSGEIEGIILHLQSIEYINKILSDVVGKSISSYDELDELAISALCEIGNIMVGGYVAAISTMTGIPIDLSVPAVAVNMLGGIMSVPMAEFGYEADNLMLIDGTIEFDGQAVASNLIMIPDIKSLNIILSKLGVLSE
jgi:chemotaxis protein CheC